jgi:hypothetical protein
MFCSIPDGKSFKVQVKGISNEAGFYIEKAFFEGPSQSDLFLTVVLVPPLGDDSPLRFFVLSHADAKKEFSKMPKCKRDGRPYLNGPGLRWSSVKPYENAWGTFPVVQPQ